jgi:hypothetical protein
MSCLGARDIDGKSCAWEGMARDEADGGNGLMKLLVNCLFAGCRCVLLKFLERLLASAVSIPLILV